VEKVGRNMYEHTKARNSAIRSTHRIRKPSRRKFTDPEDAGYEWEEIELHSHAADLDDRTASRAPNEDIDELACRIARN
jgi:hypothetical protein